MRQIEVASAQQGRIVRFAATGGASDGNKLAAVGLPNIDTLGPTGDRLHSPDEWIDSKSLVENSERLLRLLVLLQDSAE
jgi:glutamate carboxypeptidase